VCSRHISGALHGTPTESRIITSILPRREPGADPSATRADAAQAARSLGPLRCGCYQPYARGLPTRSSPWDLTSTPRVEGKTHLGAGFALRCFQRFSFLDVATQLWPGQAN
jgi:hypothetical protein